ncbi:hypothetical protein CWI38_1321p0010 [Hamiltosporidium tvaerminnensis]|uniref:Uncharacterized protein n=1 Tax=Hamiltosporidium tvaerminnensis TaxID=1176355 RepID=A0A4Q9LRP1_9MICR|nr:hypothetical protein CWI38_1321p0010 [Hamiltosporidium tvaerminnensis]
MYSIFKKLLQTQTLDPPSILVILNTIDICFKSIELEDSNSSFSDILNYKIIATKVQEYASLKHKIDVFSFLLNEENYFKVENSNYKNLNSIQEASKKPEENEFYAVNETVELNINERKLSKYYKLIGLICLLYLIKFPERASILSSIESKKLTIFLENILFNPNCSDANIENIDLETNKTEITLLQAEIFDLKNQVSVLQAELEKTKKEYFDNVFCLSNNTNCDNGVLLKLQDEITELKERLEVENSVILNAWNILAEEAFNSEDCFIDKSTKE